MCSFSSSRADHLFCCTQANPRSWFSLLRTTLSSPTTPLSSLLSPRASITRVSSTTVTSLIPPDRYASIHRIITCVSLITCTYRTSTLSSTPSMPLASMATSSFIRLPLGSLSTWSKSYMTKSSSFAVSTPSHALSLAQRLICNKGSSRPFSF